MPLTLLLMLAGLAGADETPTAAQSASSVQSVEALRTFQVTPLELGLTPVKAFQFRPALSAATNPKSSGPRETPLRNSRTGVTCTLRIIRLEVPVDPAIVLDAGRHHPDSDAIVRNDVSPCVE